LYAIGTGFADGSNGKRAAVSTLVLGLIDDSGVYCVWKVLCGKDEDDGATCIVVGGMYMGFALSADGTG
jgi:hypothetical protein